LQRTERPIRKVSPDDGGHYWYGYYDTCPWSEDETRLLVHRAGSGDRFPSGSDSVEVGYIDPRAATPAFVRFGETTAWNWQQGAHLQWLGESVLFNVMQDGAPATRIIDADGASRTLPRPVYTVAPDGRTALTLSYGRLSRLRYEYGIPGVDDPNAGDPAPEGDGVWRLDLVTGEWELIVPISRVAAHDANPMGEGADHYVNHMMFAPGGGRFCFLHRFERADGITHSRLFTASADGTDLRLLMEGMVSHYHWRDDETILAWAGARKLLGTGGVSGGGGRRGRGVKGAILIAARRTLKPVYYAMGKPRFLMNKILRDSYLLIRDEEGAPTETFARGELTTDGHCTYNRAGREPGRWVLTDGYPDLRGRQPLFLWDTKTSAGYEVGRYPTARELDGPIRADLHPRFSRDATRVCVDSAMDGSRGVWVVEVGGITGAA
jgi:hypothetical protein